MCITTIFWDQYDVYKMLQCFQWFAYDYLFPCHVGVPIFLKTPCLISVFVTLCHVEPGHSNSRIIIMFSRVATQITFPLIALPLLMF